MTADGDRRPAVALPDSTRSGHQASPRWSSPSPCRERHPFSARDRTGYHPPFVECDLGSITFNYETVGEGRQILMLHGWPLDHTQLVFEMERHFVGRGGWKRIYLDLPGMGKTPGPEWITCEDEVLDLLEEFVDSVRSEEHTSALQSLRHLVCRLLLE